MSEAEASGGCDPNPDPDPDTNFTAGPFVTRRDPVHQLIETISSLYLYMEDEAEEERSHAPCNEPFPLPLHSAGRRWQKPHISNAGQLNEDGEVMRRLDRVLLMVQELKGVIP